MPIIVFLKKRMTGERQQAAPPLRPAFSFSNNSITTVK